MNANSGSGVSGRPVAPRAQALPKLLPEQRTALHQAACQWVAQAAQRKPNPATQDALGNLSEMVVHGAFVTLKRGEHLRGCCCVLGKPMPLGAATQQAAIRTVLEDQRMAPISPSELQYLDVDVTLLGPMESIAAEGADRANFIEIGKHGLVIQQGETSGLLLPSVATERNWNAVQFLQAVCRKAGLPTDAWKHSAARVLTFEGQAVSGPFDTQVLGDQPLSIPAPLTIEELNQYVQLAANNITLIAQGATPSYYVPGLPDGTVNAIILSMQWGAEGDIRQGNAIHVSVRPGIPLQSTLFQMCQSVAQILVRQRLYRSVPSWTNRSYESSLAWPTRRRPHRRRRYQRAGLRHQRSSSLCVGFMPGKSADEVLFQLRERLPPGSKYGVLHSMQFISTLQDIVATTLPVPVRGTVSRDPAVGGLFYPAEDAARRSMVEGLCRHEPERNRKHSRHGPTRRPEVQWRSCRRCMAQCRDS